MRIGNADREEWKRIVVDYKGEKLATLPKSAPVQAFISLNAFGRMFYRHQKKR